MLNRAPLASLVLGSALALATACGDTSDDTSAITDAGTDAADDIGPQDGGTDAIDAAGDDTGAGDAGDDTVPPSHPHLANSAWPTSHYSPYSQGSSARPGPLDPDGVVEFVATGFVSITMTYAPESDDGTTVIWGSTPTGVYKAVRTADAFEVVDSALSEGRLDSLIAGAYTVLDADGVFYRTWGATLEAWGTDTSDPRAGIESRGTWTLPDAADGVAIIGLSLTWDG